MTLLKDQPPAAQTQKIYKVNSNPKVATPGRSKINKFFGEDDADIENEKLNVIIDIIFINKYKISLVILINNKYH